MMWMYVVLTVASVAVWLGAKSILDTAAMGQ